MPRLPMLLCAAAVAISALACADHAPESTASTAEPLRHPAPPRAIEPYKELVIVHPSVVADAVRTSNGSDGVWSFRALMERLAGDGDPVTFTTNWLGTFHPQNAPDAPPGPARR